MFKGWPGWAVGMGRVESGSGHENLTKQLLAHTACFFGPTADLLRTDLFDKF